MGFIMLKIEIYTKKKKAAIMKAAIDASGDILDDLKSQPGLYPYAGIALIAQNAVHLSATLSSLKTKPLMAIKAGRFCLEYRKPFKFSFYRIKKPLQILTIQTEITAGRRFIVSPGYDQGIKFTAEEVKKLSGGYKENLEDLPLDVPANKTIH